jgi:hypothetical protein
MNKLLHELNNTEWVSSKGVFVSNVTLEDYFKIVTRLPFECWALFHYCMKSKYSPHEIICYNNRKKFTIDLKDKQFIGEDLHSCYQSIISIFSEYMFVNKIHTPPHTDTNKEIRLVLYFKVTDANELEQLGKQFKLDIIVKLDYVIIILPIIDVSCFRDTWIDI